MKKILLIFLLIPCAGLCQTIDDRLYFRDNNIMDRSFVKLKFDTITMFKPSEFHNITINGFDGHVLHLDIKSDSLIVSGNLKYNKATILFMDAFRRVFYGKMDSLKNEIKVKDEEIKRLKNSHGRQF